jgi:hypothetical protein
MLMELSALSLFTTNMFYLDPTFADIHLMLYQSSDMHLWWFVPANIHVQQSAKKNGHKRKWPRKNTGVAQ